MKGFLSKVIVVLISCLAALGIAEWAVRTFSPQITGEVVFGYHEDLGAIAVPNQRGRKTSPQGLGYDFSHNSQGFRGSREYGPGKKAAYRILFLGDSFTYGVGVNDDQAFPHQVEKILQAKNYSVEIINAGSPGKGTDYELRLLQILGPQLKPDLVVLCFFWNDFYDNADGEYFRLRGDEELIPKKPHSLVAQKAKIENLPVVSWLLARSHAANLVRAVMVNLKSTPGKPEPRENYDSKKLNYNPRMTGIFINRIIAATQTLESGILFFYLPEEPEVDNYKKSRELTSYEKDFVAAVKSQKEEVYSLTPALSVIPGSIGIAYWGHYNPAAHLEAAKYISGPIEAWLKQQQSRPGERR